MRHLSLLVIGLFCVVSLQAQVESILKKAQNNIERGHLKEAIEDYKEALNKEPNNRIANMGLGMIYSELLDNFPVATPYLEKALSISVRDSSYDLIFSLAKCYHAAGNYNRALSFYSRLKGVQDLEGETNFEKEINKRREDCEFAKSKSTELPNKNIYLVNAGKSINTDMPEYVPVLTGQNELLFTSKRKDDAKEELNYLDGKYFESMYIAGIQPNSFSRIRRYTLPDKFMDSKFYKHHQAVVSLSQDGKKLFTFKDSKLFEINLDERKEESPTEVKIKKFDHYENHAFLTRNGQTLYFTSEVEGGLGGTDIYKCVKSSNGEWGAPENLGQPINTAFDEDAPYLAADGTLYFASEGHQGFGNYDIYKSQFSEGKWSEPENLGLPFNSPGHDIFLVFDSTSAQGYFSSGRNGGFGDMDIYKFFYLDKFPRNCKPFDNKALWLSSEDNDTSDFKNTVKLNLADNYKMLESSWTMNGNMIPDNAMSFEFNYGKTGSFPVKTKVLAWCDTCLSPVVACIEYENKIEKIAPPMLASTDKTLSQITDHNEQLATDNTREKNATEDKIEKKIKDKKSKGAEKTEIANNSREQGFELSKDQLVEMGYNVASLQFEFNKPLMTDELKKILNNNVEILKRNSSLRIKIYGYADARGSNLTNNRISKQRAENVKKYLLLMGLPAKQIIDVEGKGASEFLNRCSSGVSCSDEEHALNRRVELKIMQTARVK